MKVVLAGNIRATQVVVDLLLVFDLANVSTDAVNQVRKYFKTFIQKTGLLLGEYSISKIYHTLVEISTEIYRGVVKRLCDTKKSQFIHRYDIFLAWKGQI